MRQKQLLYLIILCCFSSNLFAQEKIETDRPDQTESPLIIPKKYFQFEFGFNLEKDKSNGVSTTNFVHPTSLVRYGVNENFELRLEIEPYTARTLFNNTKGLKTALAPIQLGFKSRLWEEKGIAPKTSFILHTTIPVFASKEFRHLKPAPNFSFAFQNTLSEKWAVGYNAGMEWNGESTEPVYTYTFAPGFNINEKWAGYFEIFGFMQKDEVPEHAIDAGLYFFPNNNIKLDFSAGYGLTKVTTDFYLALGLSFRFKP